jgi:hypothetical protein
LLLFGVAVGGAAGSAKSASIHRYLDTVADPFDFAD